MANAAFDMYPIYIGILAGSLPTLSMLLCSFLAVNIQFTSTFESSAQNYCAGLILGAVAKELFPQIDTASQHDNMLGITVGFVAGLFFVNYLDYFVTAVENNLTCWNASTEDLRRASEDYDVQEIRSIMVQDLKGSSYHSIEDQQRQLSRADSKAGTNSAYDSGSEADHDEEIILLASQAVASPKVRERIRCKINELISSISSIEDKSRFLHDYLLQSLPHADAELYADQIDEEIHRFQYNLDNCRRLIQGSGSDIQGGMPRIWITDRGIKSVNKRLAELKQGAVTISDALHNEELSTEALVDIHISMDRMDNQLHQLHQAIEGYSFKWGRRGKKRIIPVPKAGSFIPMGLIVPVIVDCIVDGFLVGSTSAVSPRAGIILGIANMIEMGFLGLAVSLRVSKCTGSSLIARTTVLVMPPLIMLGASVFGALSGSLAREHPVVFIGFISFGIVALLYLVVNELLVEAREAQAGKEYWWTAMVLFVGIYSVVLLDMIF